MLLIGENEQSTEYIEYLKDTKEFIFPYRLHGINDYKDKLYYDGQEWIIEKYIGEKMITGSENLLHGGESNNDYTVIFKNTPIADDVKQGIETYNSDTQIGIANGYKWVSKKLVTNLQEHKTFAITSAGCNIGFKNSELGITSEHTTGEKISLVKAYLRKNNFMVYYLREKPVLFKTGITDPNLLSLKSYNELTHIMYNTVDENIGFKCKFSKNLISTIVNDVNQIESVNSKLDHIKKISDSSPTTKYTCNENGSINIKNSTVGYIDNVCIQGKSLVNVIDEKITPTIVPINNFSYTDRTPKKTYIECATAYTNLNTYQVFATKPGVIKRNTVYTFMVDKYDNFDIKYLSVRRNEITWKQDIKRLKRGNTEIFVFKTNDLPDQRFEPWVVLERGYLTLNVGDFIHVENIIFIEGDYSERPLPEYFENIASMGEDKEMILSTRNGNILNLETTECVTIGNNDGVITKLKNGYSIANTGFGFKLKNIILPRDTELTITADYSGTNKLDMRFYKTLSDDTRVMLASGSDVKKSFKVKTADTDKYEINFYGLWGGDAKTNFSVDNISILTSGEKFQPYEIRNESLNFPVTINNTTTFKPIILRGIPGITYDTIEKLSDGEYYYIQRCGQVTLNGTESADLRHLYVGSASSIFAFVNYPLDVLTTEFADDVVQIVSDTIPSKPSIQIDSNNLTVENFGISARVKGNRGLYITVPNANLPTQNLAGFKTWLREHPVNVIYRLETPIVTELPYDLDLTSYVDNTVVKLDTLPIPEPNMSLTYSPEITRNVSILANKTNNDGDMIRKLYNIIAENLNK